MMTQTETTTETLTRIRHAKAELADALLDGAVEEHTAEKVHFVREALAATCRVIDVQGITPPPWAEAVLLATAPLLAHQDVALLATVLQAHLLGCQETPCGLDHGQEFATLDQARKDVADALASYSTPPAVVA